ncbi:MULTISPECIES: HU family DNA-binding protein [Burkholderia cepacia complex]|uniref:HU family DNA-binding protein n=2 Tax=Burkholderiaceae TaxID=119060 RepID=UPI0023EF2A9F|nr:MULTISPECIES: HU family DNA-binding protein [Burkholderia cepacia complex]MDN7938722.1 HU family DNA-binding protein [Burkholderia multivorans]
MARHGGVLRRPVRPAVHWKPDRLETHTVVRLIAVTPAASASRPTYLNQEKQLMNKSQLIDAVAKNAELTKAQAAQSVDAVLGAIQLGLQEDGDVALSGFGTFGVSVRQARTGRNPATGESIQIAASKAVKFKPGKALKDAVN